MVPLPKEIRCFLCTAAILVPQQAIARNAKGGTPATVVGTDGKVEVRPVRTSRTIGDQWLVEDALVAGERVGGRPA